MLRKGIERINEGRLMNRLRLSVSAFIAKIKKIPEIKMSFTFFEFL